MTSLLCSLTTLDGVQSHGLALDYMIHSALCSLAIPRRLWAPVQQRQVVQIRIVLQIRPKCRIVAMLYLLISARYRWSSDCVAVFMTSRVYISEAPLSRSNCLKGSWDACPELLHTPDKNMLTLTFRFFLDSDSANSACSKKKGTIPTQRPSRKNWWPSYLGVRKGYWFLMF